MDTAKGCNFIHTNGGHMKDYKGYGKASKAMLPLIAIPTTGGTGSEWETASFVVGDFVEPTATLQVRFIAGDFGSASIAEAGIDDFQVDAIVCEPVDCPTDLNGDNETGFADLLQVITAWGRCEGCPQDLDDDGIVGFADLLEIITAWGPC